MCSLVTVLSHLIVDIICYQEFTLGDLTTFSSNMPQIRP